MRYQTKLKSGARSRMYPSVDKKIEAAVRRDSIRCDASRSWIISTALAAFYDIDIIEPYETKPRKIRAA